MYTYKYILFPHTNGQLRAYTHSPASTTKRLGPKVPKALAQDSSKLGWNTRA